MAIAMDHELVSVSALEFRIYTLKEQGTPESLKRARMLQSKLEQMPQENEAE